MEIYENLDLNDLDGEIWKEVDGYDGDYFISNFGRVKSFKKLPEKIISPCKDSYGYFQVHLCNNGKRKNKFIHILLFESFNNYKLKKNECIHHIDEEE